MLRTEAGAAGELAALAYLQGRGLRLVCRNHRCRGGEIDLVMLDGDVLALVEVRFRSGPGYGGAAASVTFRKQRRIVLAARHLLMRRADLRRFRVRFDVVAIEHTAAGPQTQWIRGAFHEPR